MFIAITRTMQNTRGSCWLSLMVIVVSQSPVHYEERCENSPELQRVWERF